MGHIGTAVTADDVTTVLADEAVLVPFTRLLGALFAFVLAVTDLFLSNLFLLTHFFIDVLSLDFFFHILFHLLAGRFLLVATLEVLCESRSRSAWTSPSLLITVFVPGLSGHTDDWWLNNRRLFLLFSFGNCLHDFLLLFLFLLLDFTDHELLIDSLYNLEQDEEGIPVSIMRRSFGNHILLVNLHHLLTFLELN